MKIRIKKLPYAEAAKITPPKRLKPKKPNIFFRGLMRLLSVPEMLATHFTCVNECKDIIKNEPCLVLMNHTGFIDLEIAETIFFPRPLCIVSTHDGFIGKGWLMRQIGCIPTKKFVSDTALLSDMRYALKELKTSVLMFPEAGYTFDGRVTTLPRGLGYLAKKLDVPVVMITTYGAFARNPLYNGLQNRKTNVSAEVKLILSKEDYKDKRVAELDAVIDEAFAFDAFKYQQDNNIEISETFRADGLERILYKCPHCNAEGVLKGEGITLKCGGCGKEWTLTPFGKLEALSGETEFFHVPDWYDWQRSEVKGEIERGEYALDVPVDVYVLADYKALYSVGEGRLTHDREGFHLTGCDGELDYRQSSMASYTLNSDYFWYEIGDVIGIGDAERLYYCFPKTATPVAKARLAAEELYKIVRSERRRG